MDSTINISTELNNETFHFTRTSVYSFLQNNPWFDGTIFYLTTNRLPISSQNLTLIKKIYSKISILNLEECTELIGKKDIADPLKYQLFFQKSKIFYFSNMALFIGGVENIVLGESSKFIDGLDLFFLNKNYQFKDSQIIQIQDILTELEATPLDQNLYLTSNQVADKKFKQLHNFINSANIIFYNKNSCTEDSKIYQVWLQKNLESSQYSQRAINIPRKSNIDNLRSGKLDLSNQVDKNFINTMAANNPETKKIVDTINRLSGSQVFENTNNLVEYFKDKSICLVANSSELLKYEYGDLIDSHDIIIRFNKYKILPIHTGLRTDIHCVFRESIDSSLDYIDYKIVISKDLTRWSNFILKYHSKDAILRKYRLIDFNYPSRGQLEKVNCRGINIPTSGLATFVFLHSLGFSKNVKLIGFNGYNGGDPSSILRDSIDLTLASAHNYKLEREYWSTQFDEILPGVLKFKY